METKEGISTSAYKLEFLKSVTVDLDDGSKKECRKLDDASNSRENKFIFTVGIV